MDRLADFVLGEALDARVRGRRVGLRLPVSVNVSAVSLSAPELPAKILEELRNRRLPGDVLTVEVTETAAVDADRAADRLGTLHDAGVEVSIDDFGTGFTSFRLGGYGFDLLQGLGVLACTAGVRAGRLRVPGTPRGTGRSARRSGRARGPDRRGADHPAGMRTAAAADATMSSSRRGATR